MSESEFEFEDDEFDSYYDGEDTSANTSNQRLNIENTFYEAEDKINQDPEGAAKRFYELKATLATTSQGGASSLSASVVQSWQIKILRGLLKIPSEDFRSRCKNLRELLSVLDIKAAAETTNLIVTGLESVEHSMRGLLSEEDLKLYLDLVDSICDVATKASTPRLWQYAGLQATRVLIENAHYEQAEAWLIKLYADWMEVTLEPGIRIWDTPQFFSKISASTSEDSHLFEIIALDFDLCEHTSVDWRKRRLVHYCENFSRVMMNRRTTIRLKSSIAEYHFKRGAFAAAYPNLYDAWEANFSLGNTEVAQKQLADLMLCNILCESPIDPLSTREAQTLETKQNGWSPSEGITFVQLLTSLRELRKAVSTNEVRPIIEIIQTPPIQMILKESKLARDVPVERHLICRARRNRFSKLVSLWSSIHLDFLAYELAFKNLHDLQLFIIGNQDHLPPSTSVWISPREGLLQVTHRDEVAIEQEALLKTLKVVCHTLNISNLSLVN